MSNGFRFRLRKGFECWSSALYCASKRTKNVRHTTRDAKLGYRAPSFSTAWLHKGLLVVALRGHLRRLSSGNHRSLNQFELATPSF